MGKTSKVPQAAGGGKTGASEEYRGTWVTYEEAIAAQEEHGYDGVGFVLEEGFFFLDLDNVDINSPRVTELLDRFGSYAEISQSGKGVHIYGRCDVSQLPTVVQDGKRRLDDRKYYTKRPDGSMELYIGGLTSRYAVFTGDTLRGEELRDCTDAVLQTLETELKKPTGTFFSEQVDVDWGDSYDEELLAMDAREAIDQLNRQGNADKFRRLFYDGDVSDYDNDESRADLALAEIIAYVCGNNPLLITEVLRQSRLWDSKWERQDYRRTTIRKAIECAESGRDPGAGGLPDFVIMSGKKRMINKPALARYVREHLTYILVRDGAEQGIQIFVYEDGVYQMFAPEMMKGRVRAYIQAVDEDLVSVPVIEEVYKLLLMDTNYKRRDQLDADENLINVENGLLRVTGNTVELLPHSPDVLSTIRIPIRWTGKKAPTPFFDGYISSLAGADEDTKRLLLQFMGVALSNVRGYRMKKALFLVGPGNTGKSQYKLLLERLLGTRNFSSLDLSALEARFGTSRAYGKRLVGSADMGFATVKELRTFKQLTAGDSIFAEYKGQQGFEFVYGGLLAFCMNELPKFGGDNGDWVFDRIMVVRCETVIPEGDRDSRLLERMYAEKDGIFYQAVSALQQVIRNGCKFDEPDSVRVNRASYQRENNSAATFITESMVPPCGKTYETFCTTGTVYNIYKDWCKDNCHGYAKTDGEFKSAMAKALGIPQEELTVHRKQGNYYKDLTVAPETYERYWGIGLC